MEKKIWIILTVGVILLIGTTFAWWYWNSTTNTNISLTINGVEVTYVQGEDITGVNLIPVSSKEKGVADNTAIEKVVTASATTNVNNFNLYLTLETLPNGLKDKSFVYEVYNGVNLVGKGNFANYNQGDRIKIANAQNITSTTTSFQIYIWIDGNMDNPNTMMNQTFKFVLSADATDQDPSFQTLTKLGVNLNTTVSADNIDFNKMPYMTTEQAETNLNYTCSTIYGTADVSTCLSANFGLSTTEEWINKYVSQVDDNGVFAMQDDLGTSYYYRGNVENNYVNFAGNYWRIIRINGDGTIRMIYDGPTKKHNGALGEDNKVFGSEYNTNYNDNTYVGYMYGATSSDYTNTHSNTNDSTIKANIDKWYEDIIITGGYDKYIADAIYCNDRKVVTGTYWDTSYTGDGTGTNVSAYAPLQRITSASPSLMCNQANDKFSVTSIGNGDLTYPVALLTIDEAVMGGISIPNLANNIFPVNTYSYLSMNYWYWTMGPVVFDGGGARVWRVGDGIAGVAGVSRSDGVRPVVSLKSDITFTGTGTYDNPFEISG